MKCGNIIIIHNVIFRLLIVVVYMAWLVKLFLLSYIYYTYKYFRNLLGLMKELDYFFSDARILGNFTPKEDLDYLTKLWEDLGFIKVISVVDCLLLKGFAYTFRCFSKDREKFALL